MLRDDTNSREGGEGNSGSVNNYFVFSVVSGSEEKFLEFARKLIEGAERHLVCPRRNLVITRQGKKFEKSVPLFPGYIFWVTKELSGEMITLLKKIPGFFKFLTINGVIEPIRPHERDLLQDLIAHGDSLERSLVTFDSESRIRVIEGPLSFFEGKIIKVDKRKERARVALALHGSIMEVDLGFQVLQPV